MPLNLKQSAPSDGFAYERKIQQLERQVEDYQYEHQANLVYNRQLKSLCKLFGNENLEFEDIRQKI